MRCVRGMRPTIHHGDHFIRLALPGDDWASIHTWRERNETKRQLIGRRASQFQHLIGSSPFEHRDMCLPIRQPLPKKLPISLGPTRFIVHHNFLFLSNRFLKPHYAAPALQYSLNSFFVIAFPFAAMRSRPKPKGLSNFAYFPSINFMRYGLL